RSKAETVAPEPLLSLCEFGLIASNDEHPSAIFDECASGGEAQAGGSTDNKKALIFESFSHHDERGSSSVSFRRFWQRCKCLSPVKSRGLHCAILLAWRCSAKTC